MTETVTLEGRDEEHEVEIDIEDGDQAVDVMVAMVSAATDMEDQYVRLLPMMHLAKLYDAVVKEMNK